MRCLIADLITDLPAADGLDLRCRDYLYCGDQPADITVHRELYRRNRYDSNINENTLAYMEAAYQFCLELVNFGGFYLHASAVVVDGKAYLFSGHSRAGKSTHSRQWQALFGDKAVVINDDKPALRRIDGVWYAYGTPWCGKDGINRNMKAPVAGVCFLKKAAENKIRRLSTFEAMQNILSQTIYKFETADKLDKMLGHLDTFLREVPVYELENLPEPSAAQLSYNTMLKGFLEINNETE